MPFEKKLQAHDAVQYHKYKETVITISTPMNKYSACRQQHSNIQQQ